MKTGILTFTYGDNYGQRLQNLAVQELLKDYADEVYTIPQKAPRKHVRAVIGKIKSTLSFGVLDHFKRHSAFARFDKTYIRYFDRKISESDSAAFPQADFDYFVAGSDQIWSPFSPDVNSTMFLTFTDRAKRIALSPSISAEAIPDAQKDKYIGYFNGFDHLSVRENKGAEIIKALTGKDAEILPDPTLMHKASFWNNYVKAPEVMPKGNYACCYFLGIPRKAEKIDKICRKYGLGRIDILNDREYKILGPQEFLCLIKNASVVITDSYHGCIFSCIFHVPFIMCEREGTNINMNSRFNTLFTKLGIRDRELQNVKVDNALDVDFEPIDKNVDREREKMRAYLDSAFGRVSQER